MINLTTELLKMTESSTTNWVEVCLGHFSKPYVCEACQECYQSVYNKKCAKYLPLQVTMVLREE